MLWLSINLNKSISIRLIILRIKQQILTYNKWDKRKKLRIEMTIGRINKTVKIGKRIIMPRRGRNISDE